MSHLSIYLLLSTLAFSLLTVMLTPGNAVGSFLRGVCFMLTLIGFAEFLVSVGVLVVGGSVRLL